MSEWQPIETAPWEEILIVETEGGIVLKAIFVSTEDCQYWVAAEDHPYPDCWTDGRTWDSNENYERSDMPARWIKPTTAQPHTPSPHPAAAVELEMKDK